MRNLPLRDTMHSRLRRNELPPGGSHAHHFFTHDQSAWPSRGRRLVTLPHLPRSPADDRRQCPVWWRRHASGIDGIDRMTKGFFRATSMPDPEWWQALWPDPGEVLRALGLGPGLAVVDLCCGDGRFTLPLARLAGRVHEPSGRAAGHYPPPNCKSMSCKRKRAVVVPIRDRQLEAFPNRLSSVRGKRS